MCIVLRSTPNLLVSLGLWMVNFTSVSQFFSLFSGGMEWLEWAGAEHSFPWVS